MNKLTLELKAASLDDAGELRGYGNVTGNLDRGADIVAPGAYKNLDEFIRDGFGAVGHDWRESVATIEEAYEDDRGLFVRMKFHSTDDAQRCRTIVMERLERGKSVGLSIGFRIMPGGYTVEDNVRTLTAIEVYEVSIVTVPMNPAALVTSAKGGLADGPYSDALSAVVDAVDEIARRTKARASLREHEGRSLSQANRETLGALAVRLQDATDAIKSVMDSPQQPSESSDQARLAYSRYLEMRAREHGLIARST